MSARDGRWEARGEMGAEEGKQSGKEGRKKRRQRTSFNAAISSNNALIAKSSASSGMYSFGRSWHHSLRASSARSGGSTVSDGVRREGGREGRREGGMKRGREGGWKGREGSRRTLFLLVEGLDHLQRQVDLNRLIRLDTFRLAAQPGKRASALSFIMKPGTPSSRG